MNLKINYINVSASSASSGLYQIVKTYDKTWLLLLQNYMQMYMIV